MAKAIVMIISTFLLLSALRFLFEIFLTIGLVSFSKDSYNRCYAPIYQLRRYFDSLPDDGNGNRPECLAADPDKRQLMIISAKGGS